MSRFDNTTPTDAALVTPSATVDLPVPSYKGLWIGGAGNVNVITLSGTTVLFSGVPAGTRLPIVATRVLVASTTATLILALR